MRYRFLSLVCALLFTISDVSAQVPPNATPNYTGGWNCNRGYHRNGQKCDKTNVPANATANYTGGWNCNLGFKNVGDGCVQMSPAEAQEQHRQLAAYRARQKTQTIVYDDEAFTLRDVARKCEVYVYDRQNGDFECRSPLRFLNRRCDAYIDSWPNGSISCRGSELNAIERYCSISMYSDNYGDVDC